MGAGNTPIAGLSGGYESKELNVVSASTILGKFDAPTNLSQEKTTSRVEAPDETEGRIIPKAVSEKILVSGNRQTRQYTQSSATLIASPYTQHKIFGVVFDESSTKLSKLKVRRDGLVAEHAALERLQRSKPEQRLVGGEVLAMEQTRKGS